MIWELLVVGSALIVIAVCVWFLIDPQQSVRVISSTVSTCFLMLEVLTFFWQKPFIAPSGYDEFVIFWKKSIETFPQTRHYSSFEFSQKRRCSGPGEENLGLFVEICSDNELIKTTPSPDWDASTLKCVVSFNRNPPQVCQLTEINRKMKDSSLYMPVDEKAGFYPLQDTLFERLDKIHGTNVYLDNYFTSKLTGKGIGLDMSGCLKAYLEDVLLRIQDEQLESVPNEEGVAGLEKLLMSLQFSISKLPQLLVKGFYSEKFRSTCLTQVEKLYQRFSVDKFVEGFRFPDRVINGYCFYDDLPLLAPGESPDSGRVVIQIPPHAVKVLEKIKKKATLQFGADFCLKPGFTRAFKMTGKRVQKLSGMLEMAKRTRDSATAKQPQLFWDSVECAHKSSSPDQWICSSCCGQIQKDPDNFGCKNCGFSKMDNVVVHCFCKDDSAESVSCKNNEKVVDNMENGHDWLNFADECD